MMTWVIAAGLLLGACVSKIRGLWMEPPYAMNKGRCFIGPNGLTIRSAKKTHLWGLLPRGAVEPERRRAWSLAQAKGEMGPRGFIVREGGR